MSSNHDIQNEILGTDKEDIWVLRCNSTRFCESYTSMHTHELTHSDTCQWEWFEQRIISGYFWGVRLQIVGRRPAFYVST